MVFRNIRPRPTEQRLIKDLLVYDEYGTYGDMVDMYESRTTEIDNQTFKSLSVGSTQDAPDKPADDKQQDVESSTTSSSSSASSTSESDGPPSQDEFVTPQEPTEPVTPADEATSLASKPEMTTDNQTDFSTAIEGDQGSETRVHTPQKNRWVFWVGPRKNPTKKTHPIKPNSI